MIKYSDLDMAITGLAVAGIVGFSALLVWSSGNFSEYRPNISSCSDGSAIVEGYAKTQMLKNSETGLVKMVEGEQ